MSKHPGDPTPESASVVLGSRHYKMVVSEQSPTVGGYIMNMLVVMHCGTETHWMTTYPIAAAGQQMTWHRVEPVIETKTTWRRVP